MTNAAVTDDSATTQIVAAIKTLNDCWVDRVKIRYRHLHESNAQRNDIECGLTSLLSACGSEHPRSSCRFNELCPKEQKAFYKFFFEALLDAANDYGKSALDGFVAHFAGDKDIDFDTDLHVAQWLKSMSLTKEALHAQQRVNTPSRYRKLNNIPDPVVLATEVLLQRFLQLNFYPLFLVAKQQLEGERSTNNMHQKAASHLIRTLYPGTTLQRSGAAFAKNNTSATFELGSIYPAEDEYLDHSGPRTIRRKRYSIDFQVKHELDSLCTAFKSFDLYCGGTTIIEAIQQLSSNTGHLDFTQSYKTPGATIRPFTKKITLKVNHRTANALVAYMRKYAPKEWRLAAHGY